MRETYGGGEVLLKDGAVYVEHHYRDEAELETAFAEHVNDIFGPSALLFPKNKIRSKGGTGSIPDAFVLDLDGPRWFLVEVELDRHPPHEHIVPQVSKFRAGLSNKQQLDSLKKAFHAAIGEDPDKKIVFRRKRVSQIHEFVFETLDRAPEIRIVIDNASPELLEALEELRAPIAITVFKTYYRNGTAAKDHVHRFIPSLAAPPQSPVRPHRSPNTGEAEYIGKYRKMLATPDSLPSRMRSYIEKKGTTTLREMRRDLSDQFGFGLTGGHWAASLIVLKADGYVEIEGRGEDKRIRSKR